eukprot:5724781-Prymnesium_polylepis.1
MVNHIGDAMLSVCCVRHSPPSLSHAAPLMCKGIAFLAASQYAELVATGKARSLSPQEVAMRVIVKGKVKHSKAKNEARTPWPVASSPSGGLSPGSSTAALRESRLSLVRGSAKSRCTEGHICAASQGCHPVSGTESRC